jgi:hypothetical protein
MKQYLGMSALALLCSAGAAGAAPIALPSGPLSLQFNNAEQIDLSGANSINCAALGLPCGTTGNWGILKVSSGQLGVVNTPNELISGGGSLFFADGLSGQITGVFYGIDLLAACPTPGPGSCATGGTVDLYWNDVGVNTVLPPTAQLPNAGAVTAYTTGTFLARLNFDTGIQNNNITTVTSNINLFGQISGSGEANAFASVDTSVVGAWTSQLNQDWFFVDTNNNGVRGEAGETRDVRFRNTFNLLPTWNGGPGITGFSSTDPATAFIATVPEPASLTLLGLGLVGLARRRKKA